MSKRRFSFLLSIATLLLLLTLLTGCGGGSSTEDPQTPTNDPSQYFPEGATNPADMVGTWTYQWQYDNADPIPGTFGGTMELKADGNWLSHEQGSSYPGIWYVVGDQITFIYYLGGPSEGRPKGSVFTGTIDATHHTMSGTAAVYPDDTGTWSGTLPD